MVRPLKQGLDYFPMDVNFTSDVKVRRVRMACGMESVGILLYLLSLIYQDQGYYGKWDEELCFLTAMELHLEESLVEQVVQKAAQVGFFDAELLAEWGILTSEGIQERFLAATRKRKVRRLIQEYLLVEVTTESKIELRSVGKKAAQRLAKADRSDEASAVAQTVPQTVPQTASLTQATAQGPTESQLSAKEQWDKSEILQSEPEYQDFDWDSLTAAEPCVFPVEDEGLTSIDLQESPPEKAPVPSLKQEPLLSQNSPKDAVPNAAEGHQPIAVLGGNKQTQTARQKARLPLNAKKMPAKPRASQEALNRENWLASQHNRYLCDPQRFSLDARYAVTPEELAWIYDRAQ